MLRSGSLRIVCISDTHGRHHGYTIPPGDVLLHAGDLTSRGSLQEIGEAADFLRAQPHAHKVVIAGNHDFGFERTPEEARLLMHDLIYLCDEEATVCGLRIWGSPWQPWFFDWAFNLQRGEEIRARWDLIPDGIDILMTHGPCLGNGDLVARGERVGCADLLEAIRRIRPRLHVAGHIHEDHGISQEGSTVCVNASTCDLRYRPVQPPIVLTWGDGGSVSPM